MVTLSRRVLLALAVVSGSWGKLERREAAFAAAARDHWRDTASEVKALRVRVAARRTTRRILKLACDVCASAPPHQTV